MGDDRNIFYGVAYNGEGVAFSQTAGRIICELMTGEQSELTRLFVVNHQMPYLGPSSTRILFERLYKWHLLRTAAKTVR
jgi:glycine/D-amino acid oxidase-like deaminating enzyme